MTTWHVDADSLRRWVHGTAGPTVGVSVEQHLIHCAECRAGVTEQLPAAPLQDVWEQVITEIELPRAGRVGRVLARLGVNSADYRVLASATALQLEWIAGVAAVLSFAVIASILAPAGNLQLYLVGAPLVPVAGVVAAYGPSVDPMYELVVATPYQMVRLVLLRTATVLVASAPLSVAAGLLLPVSSSVAVLWLLPAAGFIAVVLTASIWIDSTVAAVVVGVCWVTAVAIADLYDDPLAVFTPGALAGYVALTVTAVVILRRRLLGAAPSWWLR